MKEFNSLLKTEEDTIMIVDALNLGFRWKHRGVKQFSEDYIRTVDSLKKSYKASKVIIACDSGSSTYRKEILPTYKSARKEKFAEQTEEERKEFEEFFEEFNNTLARISGETDYKIIKFAGCEADDIAAYIVNNLSTSYKIWLMSSDKDWDLLISDTVSRFSYVTRKEITKSNWKDHYEYDLEDHISIKCLTGDSGDSIPGIPGVGPKKALDLVKTYGTAYDVAANLPIHSKYKYIQNLNEFGADNILKNYKLMDLITHCDEALGDTNCAEIDKVLNEYIGGKINA